MNFSELVKKETPELSEKVIDILIPDGCVATFQIEKTKAYWIKNNITKRYSSKEKSLPNFEEIKPDDYPWFREAVIVLTSPYVSEIRNCGPKGPAVGKTGKVINDYFLYHLWAYLNASFLDDTEINERSLVDQYVGKYKLFLMNSIQYQTKYGDKDVLFDKLFTNKKVKNNLRERLEQRKPFFIINACTDDSKQKVGEVINEAFRTRNCHYLAAKHPSSGNFWSPFWEC